MSRERALRRAERERLQAQAALRRARQAARARRRRELSAALTRPARALRRRRASGLLARRRRQTVRFVVVLVLVAQVLTWALARSWATSLGVLVLSLLLAPVVVALATDRR